MLLRKYMPFGFTSVLEHHIRRSDCDSKLADDLRQIYDEPQ
ncbi:MAG TPA: hypothetical protein VK638_20705 [Edaphobacter sp.]|nr:hypothetical protein [Edaphobacter sp.]